MSTNYQPLNKKHPFHWTPPTDLTHLSTQDLIPIHAGEVALAASTMPLAISKLDNSWHLIGVAGLEEGRNLFVKEGQWLGRYQPRRLSTYGFDLQTIGELSFLRFDLNSSLADGTEVMFTADGELTAAVQEIQALLLKDAALFGHTQKAVQALVEADVLMLYPDVGMTRSQQLYAIDEAALAKLDDTTFLALRKAHALGIAYSVNLSLQQAHLLKRLEKHNPAVDIGTLFGEVGNDTLRFDF